MWNKQLKLNTFGLRMESARPYIQLSVAFASLIETVIYCLSFGKNTVS